MMPESTYQLLLDAATAWPDGIATQWIPDPGDHTRCLSWTYSELGGTATRIANALTALGVRRADAVTLCGVNTSMLYAATLAAQAVGIAAPVNPALSAERIAGLIGRTGSRVLIAAGPELDPQLWQRLVQVARQAGMTAVLALRPDGVHGDPPALDTAGDAPGDGHDAGPGPLVAYLDDVIAGQPADHLTRADGRPRGPRRVRAHRGNHRGPQDRRADPRQPARLRPGDRRSQRAGSRRRAARRAAPVPRQRADRHRHRPHVQRRPGGVAGPGGLPRQGTVRAVLADRRALPDRGDVRRPHRLRRPGPGPGRRRHQLAAAADRGRVPAALIGTRSIRPARRCRLLEGYGLTEATCASTWTRPGEERPGSVGRALPGQQVKAVRIGDDGSWTDCAPGKAGVLAIGGPAVFAGYVTGHDATGPRVSSEGVVRDGWLNTGDLGRVDADGFVYLTGRVKDLIIRGGHNIDPKVIEDALLAHPAVAAAAAVGRPDQHSGEVPVAYVVPAGPARLDEADLLAWAAAAIDEHAARPKHVYQVDTIPLTAVGKPFKPALAADAAVRAVTDALTRAGLPDARVTAEHEDGQLVVTVAGADPARVHAAVAGFALAIRFEPGRQLAAQ